MKKHRTGKRTRSPIKWNGEWQRVGKKNHHHNQPKSRGGKFTESNIFTWDISVHRGFHFLFGNRTLLEAAELLILLNDKKLQGLELDLLANDIDMIGN